MALSKSDPSTSPYRESGSAPPAYSAPAQKGYGANDVGTAAATSLATSGGNVYLAAALFATQVTMGYLSSKKKAQAARELADMRERQAQEVIKRSEFNVDSFRAQGRQIQSTQQNVAASSGIDIGSGNVLMALEDTNKKMQDAIALERRDAQWQAYSIRSGAQVARKEAEDIRKEFLPNLVSAGVQSYSNYQNSKR